MSKYIAEDLYSELLNFATQEMLLEIIKEKGWVKDIRQKLSERPINNVESNHIPGPLTRKYPLDQLEERLQNFLRSQSQEVEFSRIDVFKIVTRYTIMHQLHNPQNRKEILLDNTLQQLFPNVGLLGYHQIFEHFDRWFLRTN